MKYSKLMLDKLFLSTTCGQSNLVPVVVVLPYERKTFLLSLLDHMLCLPSGPLPQAGTHRHTQRENKCVKIATFSSPTLEAGPSLLKVVSFPLCSAPCILPVAVNTPSISWSLQMTPPDWTHL